MTCFWGWHDASAKLQRPFWLQSLQAHIVAQLAAVLVHDAPAWLGQHAVQCNGAAAICNQQQCSNAAVPVAGHVNQQPTPGR